VADLRHGHGLLVVAVADGQRRDGAQVGGGSSRRVIPRKRPRHHRARHRTRHLGAPVGTHRRQLMRGPAMWVGSGKGFTWARRSPGLIVGSLLVMRRLKTALSGPGLPSVHLPARAMEKLHSRLKTPKSGRHEAEARMYVRPGGDKAYQAKLLMRRGLEALM
jgi:hypothetical protein